MCVRVMSTCEAEAGAWGVTPKMLSRQTKRPTRRKKGRGKGISEESYHPVPMSPSSHDVCADAVGVKVLRK
jgi:hypothetical protein